MTRSRSGPRQARSGLRGSGRAERSRTSRGRCGSTGLRDRRRAATRAAASSARPALPLPDKPSIAVLPFANMSGDPEQEYFADGMVEEIITALSRIRWLFVIARNSSFTYKGQAVDVKQVGRELGRALRARRLGAQGRRPRAHHRAADRCANRRASLGRPFRRLAGRRLRASGQGRGQRRRRHRAGIAGRRDRRSASRPTNDLTAYDLYLRAYAMVLSSAKASPRGARACMEQAIARDPHYGPALAWAAVCCHRLLQ